MPEITNWRQEVKGGLGPLLHSVLQFNECLVVLIKDNPVGHSINATTTIQKDTSGKALVLQVSSTTIRLRIHRTHRGIQLFEQVRFTDETGAWIFDEARTDQELVAVQNAIRASLGIPPWDPVREPWSVNR